MGELIAEHEKNKKINQPRHSKALFGYPYSEEDQMYIYDYEDQKFYN